MISSPPAVTSRSVWSESGEPGPRTLNGDSLMSLPTTRSAPHMPEFRGQSYVRSSRKGIALCGDTLRESLRREAESRRADLALTRSTDGGFPRQNHLHNQPVSTITHAGGVHLTETEHSEEKVITPSRLRPEGRQRTCLSSSGEGRIAVQLELEVQRHGRERRQAAQGD